MKKLSPFVRYDLPVLAKMFLPTLFILLVSYHFHTFVLHAIMSNVAINSAIIIAATTGVLLIFVRLIDLQRDMGGLDRFSRETLAGRNMGELLEEPWLKGRSICHYLSHIAHTDGRLVSQLDQDAIQNELAALHEEYSSKMELPQFLVGFMVAMGLLGTFIGLLETLTGISGMLDGMGGNGGNIEDEFSKLIVELRKPLAGMGIAFSASMFGLVTSLQLSIMMIMLRRYTSRVMEKGRSVMHRLLTRIKSEPMAHGTENGEYSGVGQSAFSGVMDGEEMSSAFYQTQEAMMRVATGMGQLIRKIDALSSSLEVSVQSSQKAVSSLSFGPKMVEVTEHMLQEVRQLAQAQGDGQNQVRKIAGGLIQIDQALMANSTKEVVVAQREATSLMNDSLGMQQSAMRLTEEMLGAQREGNRAIVQLSGYIQQMIQNEEAARAELAERLEEMKAILLRRSETTGLVDTISENMERQSMMLDSALKAERTAQKNMVAALHKEIHDLGGTLSEFVNGLGGKAPEPPVTTPEPSLDKEAGRHSLRKTLEVGPDGSE